MPTTVLTDWFARKNRDETVIFIPDMYQVRLITDKFDPLQSESEFYKRAKLTGVAI